MNAAALAFALVCVDLPPQLSDLARFPSAETVSQAIRWGDYRRADFATEAERDKTDPHFWRELLAEQEKALQAWGFLEIAREESNGDWWRRENLHMLRDAIGGQAYREGRMPSLNPAATRMYAPWRR